MNLIKASDLEAWSRSLAARADLPGLVASLIRSLLVSFMEYDLGYFDLETRVLEPLENPFGPKVLPM